MDESPVVQTQSIGPITMKHGLGVGQTHGFLLYWMARPKVRRAENSRRPFHWWPVHSLSSGGLSPIRSAKPDVGRLSGNRRPLQTLRRFVRVRTCTVSTRLTASIGGRLMKIAFCSQKTRGTLCCRLETLNEPPAQSHSKGLG